MSCICSSSFSEKVCEIYFFKNGDFWKISQFLWKLLYAFWIVPKTFYDNSLMFLIIFQCYFSRFASVDFGKSVPFRLIRPNMGYREPIDPKYFPLIDLNISGFSATLAVSHNIYAACFGKLWALRMNIVYVSHFHSRIRERWCIDNIGKLGN